MLCLTAPEIGSLDGVTAYPCEPTGATGTQAFLFDASSGDIESLFSTPLVVKKI